MRRVTMAILAIAGGGLLLAAAGLATWVYVVNNVEQPPYASVTLDGPFELRDYPPLRVAEVTTTGDRRSAVNAGFSPLARYIFARDRAGDGIAMTAPVTQTPNDEKIAMTAPVTQTPAVNAAEGGPCGNTWTVRFIMPSEYALEDLPKPSDGSTVRIDEMPARRIAAVRFSGVATDDSIVEQERRLRAWMVEQNLTAKGPVTIAYYNDPWTPGPLRRNEVMIPVAGGQR